jgi:hypothetical protein
MLTQDAVKFSHKHPFTFEVSMTKSLMILLFTATAAVAGVAAADQDPTLQQVYQAAENGHLAQAQQMMGQVLKDHPNSAKAHFVTSELDAKAGQFAEARDEFHTAERLDPGLSFEKPDSVNALRAELFPAAGAQLPAQHTTQTYVQEVPVRQHHSGFPWGMLIGVVFLVWVIRMIFFRRRVVTYGGPGGYRGGPDGYMGGGPGPYYGGGGYGGGGLGSSLASGLAVGAGVAVGEELTERLLDGGGRERVIERDQVEYRDAPQQDLNGDMGGSDFGASDSGGWDDNSGGGGDSGGGGSDW